MRSLALRNPELAELVANATRKAFEGIIDLCIEEQVAALLIAGDLYDGDQTSMKTAGYVASQIRRLAEAGIQTIGIRGNHDAESKITKELVFPDGVTFFKGAAGTVTLPSTFGRPDVVVHGISFPRPEAPESLLPEFKPPVEGAINIGLLHTSLAGAEGHDRYAPCSVADLTAMGFNYWALGHVHKRQVHSTKPAIVMPGMPQGRDINESGPKSATLVKINDDRTTVELEERRTSIAQFERVPVDLSGIDDWADGMRAIGRRLRQVREAAQSEHLIARVTVSGHTPLSWRLRRDRQHFLAEVEQQADIIGGTWIEKVETQAAPPTTAMQDDAGALAELARLVSQDVIQTDGYRHQAVQILEELRGNLPRELRSIFGDDEAAFAATVDSLASEGTSDVLAHLHHTASEEDPN